MANILLLIHWWWQYEIQLQPPVLQPLYRSTCVSRHLQLRSGGFCWCKVLLLHALADGNQCIWIREKTLEFCSTVIYTVSILRVSWVSYEYLHVSFVSHMGYKYCCIVRNAKGTGIGSPVVDEERMRPGHWFQPLPCVSHSSLVDTSPMRALGCNAHFIRFLILALYIWFASRLILFSSLFPYLSPPLSFP